MAESTTQPAEKKPAAVPAPAADEPPAAASAPAAATAAAAPPSAATSKGQAGSGNASDDSEEPEQFRALNSLFAAIESTDGSEADLKFDALNGPEITLTFASTSGRNRPKKVCAVPTAVEENPLYKSVSMLFRVNRIEDKQVPVKVEVMALDVASLSKLWILDKSKGSAVPPPAPVAPISSDGGANASSASGTQPGQQEPAASADTESSAFGSLLPAPIKAVHGEAAPGVPSPSPMDVDIKPPPRSEAPPATPAATSAPASVSSGAASSQPANSAAPNTPGSSANPDESTEASFVLHPKCTEYSLLLRPMYVSRRAKPAPEETKGKSTRFVVRISLHNRQVLQWTFRLYCPRYGARLPKTRTCMFNSTPTQYVLRCDETSSRWRTKVQEYLANGARAPSAPNSTNANATSATAPTTATAANAAVASAHNKSLMTSSQMLLTPTSSSLSDSGSVDFSESLLSKECSMDETPAFVSSQASTNSMDYSSSDDTRVPDPKRAPGDAGDSMREKLVVGVKRNLSFSDSFAVDPTSKRQKTGADTPPSPDLATSEHLTDSPVSDGACESPTTLSERVVPDNQTHAHGAFANAYPISFPGAHHGYSADMMDYGRAPAPAQTTAGGQPLRWQFS